MGEVTTVYKYFQGNHISKRKGLVTIFWDVRDQEPWPKVKREKIIVVISKKKNS